MKTCLKCGETKHESEFYSYAKPCRECCKISVLAWMHENKDKVKTAQARYKRKYRLRPEVKERNKAMFRSWWELNKDEYNKRRRERRISSKIVLDK